MPLGSERMDTLSGFMFFSESSVAYTGRVGVLLNVVAIPEAFISRERFRRSSLISSQVSANSLALGTWGNGRILGRFAF